MKDCKTTALEEGVRVETGTEGGNMFMTACRKGEGDTFRHRQEKIEANETR